jgi:hypothetical protein
MSHEYTEENNLLLAAEDWPAAQFPKVHKFSSFEQRIVKTLIAHGPVLLRGGRGSGKSALLIEADRQIGSDMPLVLSVYISLRHLPLLRSEGKIYESILCGLLVTEIRKKLTALGLATMPATPNDAGQLRQALGQLSSKINRRIVLMIDDAAHLGRETALTEFFDIFRTISSSTVSVKASIYPGVTRFGTRFDVFNDATIVDVARDERSPEFASFFESVLSARFPSLKSKITKLTPGRGLHTKYAATLLGRTVVGNMRAFVFACNWLEESEKVGFVEINNVMVRLASDYYWPLLDEVAPKLGPYEPLVETCRTVAEVVFRYVAVTDSCGIIVHRDIVQKLAKLFEILEYVGFLSRREASRSLKSGGRGPRFALNLATLLEARPKARLTSALAERWLQSNAGDVDFHINGTVIPMAFPDVETNRDLAVFALPISKVGRSKVYPYGLTTNQVSSLEEAGYTTIGAVANASDEQLDDIPKIGLKTVEKIRHVITQAIWM